MTSRVSEGLFAILLASCCASERMAGGSDQKGGVSPRILSEATTSHTVDVGEIVEVRLTAQVGAGYEWELARPMPSGIELIETGEGPWASDVEGAPEVRIFRFKTLSPGLVQLSFHHRRPWLADGPPQRTATYRLDIRR